MVVAFGAAQGEAHKGFAKSIGAVNDVFSLKFFFNDAPLHVLGVIAVERGGNDHVFARLGHHVSGQLPLDELVVPLIGIERFDDPIAVGRHVAQAVNGVAM